MKCKMEERQVGKKLRRVQNSGITVDRTKGNGMVTGSALGRTTTNRSPLPGVKRARRRKDKAVIHQTFFVLGLCSLTWITISSGTDMLSETYFEFPDHDSPYFEANTKGMAHTLSKALKACPNARKHLSNQFKTLKKVQIIFDSQRAPTAERYIQFQTEQLQSPLFTQQYLDKMANAQQVWEFSPRIAETLRSGYGLKNVHYIPLMLTYGNWVESNFLEKVRSAGRAMTRVALWLRHHLSRDSRNAETKLGQNQDESAGFIYQYTNNCYVQWKQYASSGSLVQTRNTERKFTMSGVSSSSCPRDGLQCEYTGPRILEINRPIDVLLYGFLPCSHENIRERVCDALRTGIVGGTIMCLHQVFGKELDYFIENSKIILNVPFYKDASLGTHRIDPLILREKTVVSLPSFDPHLDALYRPLVYFANETSLIEYINILLGSLDQFRSKRRYQTRRYVDMHLRNIAHVCKALEEL